jgi:hypothetical protein
MKDRAKLAGLLKELLSTQRLAVLATHDEGQPHTSLVAFDATEDLCVLTFATSRATRKFANLSADSRVAFLIDNRSNQTKDFRAAAAATVVGKACEITGGEKECLIQPYLAKHPHLKEFVTAPTCAFLKVTVEKYSVVTRFQEVMELYVGSE